MTRPLIGITVGDAGASGRHSLRADYVLAVEQAGGAPVLLPPLAPEAAALLLARFDGLLLSGGGDVDPCHFGARPHPKLGPVDTRRDLFELALAQEAIARDLPLLAICRGVQLLNVARGGTLLQHIPSELEGAVEHEAAGRRARSCHEVHLLPDSRLREILERETLAVNSFHHQAVDRVGNGLEATGHCPTDGVTEALEMPTRRFVIGVQWHPECYRHRPSRFQRLFAAHVEACRQ